MGPGDFYNPATAIIVTALVAVTFPISLPLMWWVVRKNSSKISSKIKKSK